MDYPIELMWTIPILVAFLIGLYPKPFRSYSCVTLVVMIGLAYFVSCYQVGKQGMLLMALLMALPYIAGLTILALIIGIKIRKLKSKKYCQLSIIISGIFILCIGTYTLLEVNNIRKDKYLIQETIKTIESNPLILKEVGNNPKSTLFNHEFDNKDNLTSLEIRVKGKKVLYAIVDVSKNREIQLKCITALPPMKRIKDWNKSCLR